MTTPAPDLDLAAIRTRADAATPVPWTECKDGNCTCGYIFGDGGIAYIAKVLSLDDDVDPVAKPEQQMANAAFITRARIDVVLLVDEVARLRGILNAADFVRHPTGPARPVPIQEFPALIDEAAARIASLEQALRDYCFGDPALENILFGDMPDDAPMTFTVPLGVHRRARAALADQPATEETER